jgi:hypothetical protein
MFISLVFVDLAGISAIWDEVAWAGVLSMG